MAYRLGIDIGGTFTDLVFLGPAGRVLTAKVLSTPDDYSRGIAEGLGAVFAAGEAAAAAVEQVVHGTTVATNAILEGKGARVGLLTTEGFRDVLEIRRLRMPVLYDIRWRKPEPLVGRERRMEVAERIDSDGAVERPLDEAGARAAIAALLAEGVDAIAICLLNAYASGAHEERLAALVAEAAPGLPVCVSSALLPEIKEYERTSTTVVNAYVMPVVSRYLRSLTAGLTGLGVAAPLRVMQSSGGAMGVEAACVRPIHLIESGPAAGVVGAAELSRRLGGRSLIAFDMGGTTAKAALVAGGAFDRVGSLEVGGGINVAGRLLSGGGYHVRAPAIDIAEVGAGGGSLVEVDAGGGLRVGPKSAGAAPGPACYGRGGTLPTVTDANVVLGFVNPEYLAGGSIPVDRALAERAIAETVARPLGVDLATAAWGVHRVANATMGRALRAVSTERGRDPRDFSVLAFGGNGPIHAAALAASLDVRRILVPPVPGLFSALGMLFPDTEHHFVRTFKRRLDGLDAAALDAAFAGIEADGARALAEDGYAPAAIRFERLADLRYLGENSELTLPIRGAGPPAEMLRADFDAAHERTYGYHSGDETAEIVNLRLVARGLSTAPRVPDRLAVAAALGSRTPGRGRPVYFGPEVGWVETPTVGRAAISAAWEQGPLLVEEYDSTTVVPPGARVRRILWDVLEVELEAGR
ncbi:MAG: hydantoinase/oxoprolinase family protein [Alphaproteobacteria bacterium]|nr:hydantoinase/oxoprolinase family protein [Alphaproteobacteria bacterium]